MIREDIRDLKTGKRELRRFGLLVGGVFVALGLLGWVRGKSWFAWPLVPGTILVLAGGMVPRGLKWVYLAWMTLAILLGFVVSTMLLTLFFFLVITPVGLVARLFREDFLRLRLDRTASSYWISRERSRKAEADYERQF